jgi:thermitase
LNNENKPEISKSVLLNDSFIAKNWGLSGSKNGSDIRANFAWQISEGDKSVKVAVIDTGADINHPDIFCNLWKNPGETGFDKSGKDRATNNIDDDGNGIVDDIYGVNFDANNNDLTDNHGHGTHIAGIVGGCGKTGDSVTGVARKVSMMILKYYDPKSKKSENLKNTIRAIRYAIDKKVDIINYSGGGTDFSQEEYLAIKEARDKGILFVAAAGNEYSNSDQAHYYPANYNLDNIISVTAINKDIQVLKSSNYGTKTVHIAAPGENIYSALPNNRYGVMTGTSQATAFVSGVAALLKAQDKDATYLDMRNKILQASDEEPTLLAGKTKNYRKLNSYKALAMQSAKSLAGTNVVQNDATKIVFSELSKNSIKQSELINRELSSALTTTSTNSGSTTPIFNLKGLMKSLEVKNN